MKYIIEIAKEYEEYFKGILICGIVDGKFAVDVTAREDLEELNSDYINEHFGDLQDTAYQKGFEDGKKEAESSEAIEQAKADAYQKGILFKSEKIHDAYQRGLNDAWEAAKKIALMDTETSENVTGYFGLFRIMNNLTASEAIEKLKAYEEKQKADDKIEVGDEVEWTGDKYIVTYINYDIDTSEITDYDLLGDDGSVADHVKKCSFTKTGRHFDIASILEAMKA